MPYLPTTAVRKLAKLTKRIKGVQGGTSASKTISILQILIDRCQRDTVPCMTSVTSESIPHLKRGAMRDFKSILLEQGYWKDERWNATDFIYTFETGSTLEFFSLDQPHKVRGPRRKRLFINEANNIPFETFDQLEIRTEDEIWLDWNPVSEFWWHTEIVPQREVDSIILTYKDNEGLSQNIIESIESHKENKNWWKVYGLGQIGEIEGRIYTDWAIVDDIPHEARLERYGLDFGYSNDPTAVVAIYRYNGGFIFDEILYRKGMLNKNIADYMKSQKDALIIADSAEPKSIEELNQYGLQVTKSKKGPDSLLHGIQTVQQQRCSVTKRSVNILKEQRSYMWQTDPAGKLINIPESGSDHCFVGNTKIITNEGITLIKNIKENQLVLTSKGYKKVVKKWDNGIKQVNKYSLQFDTFSVELESTPNHKIKTGSTWTEISKLQSGQMVTLTNFSTGLSINFIQEKNISQNILKECILLFGKISMDLFQKVIKFIIKIRTLGIIPYKTSNWLLDQNTYLCMQNVEQKKTKNGLFYFKKLELKKQKSGINLKMEKNGTQNMQKSLGLKERLKHYIVNFVEKYTKQNTQEYQNTVIKTAKLKRIEVKKSSNKKVYDLTVEDCHEYFANGILVHNCLDAIRYGIRNIIPDDHIQIKQFTGQAILNELLESEY